MSSLVNPVTISGTASGGQLSKPILQVEPYLFFEGRCEEALEYYGRTLGAEVLALMRFKDGPPGQDGAGCGPGLADKVMHATFRIGNTTLMASDGKCEQPANFQGFSLSITTSNDENAQKFFAALSEGGRVQMPLGKTFFASQFGMVVDRFGISWMVISGAAGG
jgi:PhnB protein